MRELGFHRASRRGRDEMRDPFGRSMGAMGGRERVIDVDIAERGERFGKFRIVLLFARMKARVLQQQHVAVLQFRHGRLRDGPDAIFGECDGAAEHARECCGERLQRHAGHDFSAGPVEMGEHDDARPLVGKLFDGGGLAFDARRVRDHAILHRHVEVGAHQHALPLDVQIVERAVGGHRHHEVKSACPWRPPYRPCGSRSPTHCRTTTSRARMCR